MDPNLSRYNGIREDLSGILKLESATILPIFLARRRLNRDLRKTVGHDFLSQFCTIPEKRIVTNFVFHASPYQSFNDKNARGFKELCTKNKAN